MAKELQFERYCRALGLHELLQKISTDCDNDASSVTKLQTQLEIELLFKAYIGLWYTHKQGVPPLIPWLPALIEEAEEEKAEEKEEGQEEMPALSPVGTSPQSTKRRKARQIVSRIDPLLPKSCGYEKKKSFRGVLT